MKNLQGDVVAIADANGNIVVNYAYDAWGNILSITDGSGNDISNNTWHIGNLNPIRYRSYYYDTETGFYYLQTRYYDPAIRRFINADGYVNANGDIIGFNMYAYCGNNPVIGYDPTGEWFKETIDFIFVKPFKAFWSAIEAEVGFGDGIDGNLVNFGGGQYTDTVVGFDDGEIYTGHVSSTDIPIGPIGFNRTKMHYSEIGYEYVGCDNYEQRTYRHINSCDVSQESIAFSLGPITINSDFELIISASVSAHFLFGGHASIGFNITEYYERWLFSE